MLSAPARKILTPVLCGILLITAGCGRGSSGPERYTLSGTVSFKGQPVPRGDIMFVPDHEQQNQGPGSFSIIENGRYETAADKGIVGGHYVITVNGYPAGSDDDDSNPLFPPYEMKVELPAAQHVLDIEVPEE